MNTLVLEEGPHGDMPVDVYQKLADDRIIFVGDSLSHDMATTDIIATLILKDFENSDEKITIFLNSDGGSIRNYLAVFDVMQLISAPVEVICSGSAMDEAVILLAGATPGLRMATEHSVISISQLVQDWMTHTNITDGKSILDQLVVDNNRVMSILSKTTGRKIAQIKQTFERKMFFTAAQALKFGIIDRVISAKKEAPEKAPKKTRSAKPKIEDDVVVAPAKRKGNS
jgi:ATP-dependent Clp protease protease subunit